MVEVPEVGYVVTCLGDGIVLWTHASELLDTRAHTVIIYSNRQESLSDVILEPLDIRFNWISV